MELVAPPPPRVFELPRPVRASTPAGRRVRSWPPTRACARRAAISRPRPSSGSHRGAPHASLAADHHEQACDCARASRIVSVVPRYGCRRRARLVRVPHRSGGAWHSCFAHATGRIRPRSRWDRRVPPGPAMAYTPCDPAHRSGRNQSTAVVVAVEIKSKKHRSRKCVRPAAWRRTVLDHVRTVRPARRHDRLELDRRCHDYIVEPRGLPIAPLNYKGFPQARSAPRSTRSCATASPAPSHAGRRGDIINLDITTIVDGYHGDTSEMFDRRAP